ncbi:MAG: hypothetical protein EOP38_13490 [Rubrivivax sp.]|nr:MAG: hypothetical protein EOP38_13490 [Rubrivivax sp.]
MNRDLATAGLGGMNTAVQAGFYLPRGLQGTTAQWTVPLGVTRALPVRRAAQALILSMVLIMLVWWRALMADALSGQGRWQDLVWAVGLGASWLAIVKGLWQGLSRPAELTLLWGGDQPQARSGKRASEASPPGWSVPEWAQRVSLHVVFVLGPWHLVKVSPQGPGERRKNAWSWLDARVCFEGPQGHQWRSLLFSRQANGVGSEQALHTETAAVVASCGTTQRRWSNLFSSFNTAGYPAGQGVIRREAGARQPMATGDDFPATLILDPARSSPPPQGRRS